MGSTDKERQNYYKNMVIDNRKIKLNRRFLGSNEFIKAMEEQFGISNIQRKNGRPRKYKQEV